VPFFDAVAQVARQQHGLITTHQLAAAGLSDRQVRTLVANGVLVRRCRSVYALAGTPPTWDHDLHCAVLASGPDAAVSHRSAATIWRLHRYRNTSVDITTVRWRRRTATDWKVHESLSLPSRDVTVHRGMPITTPTRTLIDVARYLPPRRLGSMVDDAVVRELTSYEDLHLRFVELARRGRDGIATMREVLEDRPCGTVAPDSAFEMDVFNDLRSLGPDPVLHHRVRTTEVEYVLDIAWPEFEVAVECDGFRFHRTPEQLEWDDQRRNRLTLQGWIVLHETWSRRRSDPRLLLDEAGDALRSRGADLRRRR